MSENNKAEEMPTVRPRHAEYYASAAELSPLPFLMCDAKAKVVASSRGARALVNRNKVLGYSGGRIKLPSRALQQKLLDMLAQVAAGEAPDPRTTSLILKLPRDGQATLTLMVSAIPDMAAPPIVIFIHEPTFTARISESVLCELYELTPAEARVARIMVNGGDTHEIARQNNTSVHTVRNQIKNVFSKTGASRQAELAILLLGGPAHTR